MKIQTMTCAAISAALFSTSVFAQTAQSAGTGYVGIQAAQIDIDIDHVPAFEPIAAIAKLGYNVVDFIAIEGRVGAGLTSDSNTLWGEEVDVELDMLAGLYAVGRVPLAESNISLYGVLGYTYIEASEEVLGFSATAYESGVSYGAGLQAQLTPTVSANLEYMSYLDKSDYDITAIGVGVNYHYQY